MLLPFDTHTIYITLDDNKVYKLNNDFSKEEVKEIPISKKENPYMLVHKSQFDYAKAFLLNKENPFKMSLEDADIYNKIGFISDTELLDFNNIKKQKTLSDLIYEEFHPNKLLEVLKDNSDIEKNEFWEENSKLSVEEIEKTFPTKVAEILKAQKKEKEV